MFKRCGTRDGREVSGKGTGGELKGPRGRKEWKRSGGSAAEKTCHLEKGARARLGENRF